MSLSDCPQCWDTPCTCGLAYKDYTMQRAIELVTAIIKNKIHEQQRVILDAAYERSTAPDKEMNIYQLIKEYLLSGWSPGLITTDTGEVLQASNGNRTVIVMVVGGNTFLTLSKQASVVFNGIIQTKRQFLMIWELTSLNQL